MGNYYTQVSVTPSSEEWIATYNASVPAIVAKHGGSYLAVTTDFERIEGNGEDPSILVIVQWPDRDSAQRFYDDASYQEFKALRLAGARNDMYLLPGLGN